MDPKEAAKDQCDKHVVKMVLESCQMLSTALRLLCPDIFENDTILYKKAHINHPSTAWVRSSKANFDWLLEHCMELCLEYTRRYGRVHKSQSILEYIIKVCKVIEWDFFDFTEPPLCMPDEYKKHGSVVESYQAYYIGDKSRFAIWKYSKIPEWYPVFSSDQLEFIRKKFCCEVSGLQEEFKAKLILTANGG